MINTGSVLAVKQGRDSTRVIMTDDILITGNLTHINLLKPTCYVMHHQFNTQQLRAEGAEFKIKSTHYTQIYCYHHRTRENKIILAQV